MTVSSPDHLDDTDLAAWLVRAAGTLADGMRSGVTTFQEKTSISDVVTAADHAAEKLVVDTLRDFGRTTRSWARKAPATREPRAGPG